MVHMQRCNLPSKQLPGRITNKAVGAELPENGTGLMAGFATFSPKYGNMITHKHENEYMLVLDAKNATVSYGFDLNNLITEDLIPGQILRPVNGEWHRFDFTSDDGYVDFLNFFPKFPPHTVLDPNAQK